MRERIKKTIDAIELHEKVSFICHLEIDFIDFKELFPDKRCTIDPGILKHLKESIEFYPLYGGGLDDNGVFNIVVMLKSSTMKIENVQENFDYRKKLRKRRE